MGEVEYISNTSLINEANAFTDILDKDSTNIKIITSLLSRPCSSRELSELLSISLPKIELSLNRLLNKNIVHIKESKVKNDKIVKIYGLVSSNIHLLTENNVESEYKDMLNSKIASNNICELTKEMLDKIHIYKEQKCPYTAKAIFINVNTSKVELFKKELDKLLLKFESMEDESENETFGLVSVLTPYNK